jgi:hypothetical protein
MKISLFHEASRQLAGRRNCLDAWAWPSARAWTIQTTTTYLKNTLAKAQGQQRKHFLLELAFSAHVAVPPYESRRAAESGSGTLREISSKPRVLFEMASSYSDPFDV